MASTFMTGAQARALPVGTAVRLLASTSGQDHQGTERKYPRGAVGFVGSIEQDRVTVAIGKPNEAIVNVFEATDFEGGTYPFALGVLETLICTARQFDDGMCDPHQDGSGNDARAPTGDDYNALLDFIEAAAATLIEEA